MADLTVERLREFIAELPGEMPVTFGSSGEFTFNKFHLEHDSRLTVLFNENEGQEYSMLNRQHQQ